MIVAWRLVKARYATSAFSGDGARQEGGRWNPKGTPAVYLADHPALSALEIFVHLKRQAARIRFTLFRVEIPNEVKVSELAVAGLPGDWRAEPPVLSTMAAGEKWHRAGHAAVLRVPSALIPAACNLVLNPEHRDFHKIRIGTPADFSFDPRMWK